MKETKRKKIIAKQKKVKIQDLTIKYNQSEVFSECSECNNDMEGFWQSPFAFFSNDGKNPVCWTCAEKMSPDCVDLLRSFYYPTNAFSNRLVEKKSAEESRLNRLEFEDACSD